MKTTKQYTITLPLDLAETIEGLADSEDRSLSNVIKRLIELGIKDKD